MHTRKPPSDSVLFRAVESRAAGNSWEAVAKLVRRSPHTVRKWPQMYSQRWIAALRKAERTVIDSAAAESVLVLRELLRSVEEKVRVEAAWRLVFQRLELNKIEHKAKERLSQPEPPTAAQLIAQFLEAHSHEHMAQLAESARRFPLVKRA